jgi:hypothetical protein
MDGSGRNTSPEVLRWSGALWAAIMGGPEVRHDRSNVPISDGLHPSGEVGLCATQLAVGPQTLCRDCAIGRDLDTGIAEFR